MVGGRNDSKIPWRTRQKRLLAVLGLSLAGIHPGIRMFSDSRFQVSLKDTKSAVPMVTKPEVE
jgi:hypothetical protein